MKIWSTNKRRVKNNVRVGTAYTCTPTVIDFNIVWLTGKEHRLNIPGLNLDVHCTILLNHHIGILYIKKTDILYPQPIYQNKRTSLVTFNWLYTKDKYRIVPW